jgi:hypothetical protein
MTCGGESKYSSPVLLLFDEVEVANSLFYVELVLAHGE